jgi:hypothetical protein
MMAVSERRICRVFGQHRSTQRKAPRGADDEAALTEDIIALARQYGRYGYRRDLSPANWSDHCGNFPVRFDPNQPGGLPQGGDFDPDVLPMA